MYKKMLFMCRSGILLFHVKYFESDHETKFIRRAMLQRSLENCLEENLTVEFCALFISWGSFHQLVIFHRRRQLAAHRSRITLLA